MITVRLSGALGNQMFQYALGRRIALQNNTQLCLDLGHYEIYKDRKFALNCFRIPSDVIISGPPKYYYDFRSASTPKDKLKELAKKISGAPRLVLEHGFLYDNFVGLVGSADGRVGRFDQTI